MIMPNGRVVSDASGDYRFTVSRRQSLPSVAFPLACMCVYSLSALLEATAAITGGPIFLLGFAAMFFCLAVTNYRSYHKWLAQRSVVRAKNLDAVEDWIIKTELPAPSEELQKRLDADEAEYLVWVLERELQVCREKGMDRHHTWMRMHSLAHPTKAKDEPYEDYQRRYTVMLNWFAKWDKRRPIRITSV